MIRVLTNDGLEAASIDALKALGVEVVNEHIGQDELDKASENSYARIDRTINEYRQLDSFK